MTTLRHCLRFLSIPRSRTFSSAPDSLAKVDVNLKTGVAVVSMQRLPVNSLNLELLEALGRTFDELEKNKCRGMILTSESPTVFSAGLDIMEMYKPDPARVKQFWTTLQNTWMKLYGSSFPTVAAINGQSPAGGCLLALSCEYRVMVGGKNVIGLNETKLGIIAPKWFMDCMRNVIGERQAELALTLGKLFPADDALKVGLVDELATDKADALAKAEQFLASFAKVPAMARAYTKQGYRNETIDWLRKNQEKDLQTFLNYVNQPQVQQGLEMYLQSLKKK
ncbi:enoyl-CoA delta isomerase 1, mitochondrial-like [Macrosteles quadrilineatus]|uniref:enoyl-CoA delta isomerase 1, mitochondrial-like n=1 Tax=Macrosteles quadrilineatus TaxID=74068 RepID=UPI0023E3355A|nr:enoyl-CoA delta isomerase 1, mitochondrial-like [Macrosteles quadrilineatus]XP_054286554.1 enoyl-CoA delta isomerase 1, mitochondrial-like [Macrosteles quadrilineatus]